MSNATSTIAFAIRKIPRSLLEMNLFKFSEYATNIDRLISIMILFKWLEKSSMLFKCPTFYYFYIILWDGVYRKLKLV